MNVLNVLNFHYKKLIVGIKIGELMAKNKAKGNIVEIYNNYGIIRTDSFKKEGELIPFEIKPNMITEIEEVKYINYTKEVKFKLNNSNQLRHKNTKEAINVEFVGEVWEKVERKIEDNYLKKVKKRFEKYNISYPIFDSDNEFYEYLKDIGFQPRMVEYLVDGLFLAEETYIALTSRGLEKKRGKFCAKDIVYIDKVDREFRMKILNWIIGLEDSYKSFFSRAVTGNEIGALITNEIIDYWKNKNPKGKKQFNRAKDKFKYRKFSDNFDYVSTPNTVPLSDLLEQIDLSELKEFTRNFEDIATKNGYISPWLILMKKHLSIIDNLILLRNAAAHGRPLIPGFTDLDFNGNWDLEFDNIEDRGKVEEWFLFEPLAKQWRSKGFDNIQCKQLVNIAYGNPYRRAWMELHYAYLNIIPGIDSSAAKQFGIEAEKFLSYSEKCPPINWDKVPNKLSDMSDTTFENETNIPAPYKEISNEAFFIWKI